MRDKGIADHKLGIAGNIISRTHADGLHGIISFQNCVVTALNATLPATAQGMSVSSQSALNLSLSDTRNRLRDPRIPNQAALKENLRDYLCFAAGNSHLTPPQR